TWTPRLWANFKTSVGAQYLNQESDGTSVTASQLGPGVQGVNLAGSRSGSNTAPTATKTLGAFTQEQMAFRDRLCLTAGVRTDQSALSASNIGNTKLRPERTLEWEGGLDLRAFNNRVSMELTYYSKQTRDALESYSYAPSAAASSSITRNLGGVKNAGIEASI